MTNHVAILIYNNVEALDFAAPSEVFTTASRVHGRIITSAGISAGIDMYLHLVSKLAGQDLALKTARQMDHAWQQTP